MKKKSSPSAKKTKSVSQHDQQLLLYKQALILNMQIQDQAVEALAKSYRFDEQEEDYLFDYLFNSSDKVTFSAYLKNLGVTLFEHSVPSKYNFKVTIDDGYCRYGYELAASDCQSINDIAVKLSEVGRISPGKLQPPVQK